MEKNISVNIKNAWVFSLLGIVFIVLRLCKVIDWSWVWVLSPFWIPLAIIMLIFIILIIIGLLS